MNGGSVRLGIDFGTSTTVAVLALGDREPRPLLFDGSPLLPSAVCVDPTGRLLVGRDAVQLAAAVPAGFEPNPKRIVDDGTVLLAGRELPVGDLIEAVLRRVVDEASRAAGAAPTELVIAHPAGWGAARKAVLERAAPAGARLVPEPAAAAHYFVEVAGQRLPDGATAVVYDLGAGTFDASLVRRDGAGFTVTATTGLTDAGGLDIDAAIVAYLRTTVTGADTWTRLDTGDDPVSRRARLQLWDNVRAAKEVLSRLSATLIHLPLFDADVPLSREELDRLAAPLIARTITATRDLVGGAEIAAVFLAGGASRMPAVATALHRALGLPPSLVDQPELVVAEGTLRAFSASARADIVLVVTGSDRSDPGLPAVAVPPVAVSGVPPAVPVARPAVPAGLSAEPAGLSAVPGGPSAEVVSPRARRRAMVVAAVAGPLLILAGTLAWATQPDGHPSATGPAASPSATRSPSPSVSPSPSYPPGIDRCLLGNWRQYSRQSIGYIDSVPVQYTGGAGATRTFGVDGSSLVNYTGSAPMTATHQNAQWRMHFDGTLKATYFADGKLLRWRDGSAAGTASLYRNGSLNTKVALTIRMEPDDYICSPDRLTITSIQNDSSSDWERA